jgi:hypothetical protein
MEQLGSNWTVFHEIWYLSIFRKSAKKFQVSLKCDKNNGPFTWRPMYIYDNISLNSSQNEMFQAKRVKKSKHILCSMTFFRKLYRLWDKVENVVRVGQAIDDNIVWRMRVACWITKTTETHSKCVTIIAFPRQQWLRERATVLRYTYIAWFVMYITTGSPRLTLAQTTLFCFNVALPWLSVVLTGSWWDLLGQTVGWFNWLLWRKCAQFCIVHCTVQISGTWAHC